MLRRLIHGGEWTYRVAAGETVGFRAALPAPRPSLREGMPSGHLLGRTVRGLLRNLRGGKGSLRSTPWAVSCRPGEPVGSPWVAPQGSVPTQETTLRIAAWHDANGADSRTDLIMKGSAELDVRLLLGLDGGLATNSAPGEGIGPGLYGDLEQPAWQLLYVIFGDPGAWQDSRDQCHSFHGWDAGGPKTLAELGAGERVRTAGLPFTRSTAPCTECSTCTDDTDHCTHGTHHAGIIWRVRRVRRPGLDPMAFS
jgi:hypothetical protein